MKRITNILFFNALLLIPCATKTMNTFRAFGSRASKTAFEAATKFKLHAQSFKSIKQPLMKSFNFKDGQGNYKTSARMLPAMSVSFIYAAYNRLKISLGYAPPLTPENIDKYPEYKDTFIRYALKHSLPAVVVKTLMIRYPEHAESVAVCQYYLLCKSTYPDDPVIIPLELENPELQSVFTEIKLKMGITWDMPLVGNTDLQHEFVGTTYHTKTKVPFFYIAINPQAQLTDAWKHVVAHETAHIASHHIEKAYFLGDHTTPEGLALARQFEYEADEKAVLALGSITGGMEFLGAIPGANNEYGWKLPDENVFHTNLGPRVLNESHMTHPSNANRCRALLALVEKHPEKFNKPGKKIKGKHHE